MRTSTTYLRASVACVAILTATSFAFGQGTSASAAVAAPPLYAPVLVEARAAAAAMNAAGAVVGTFPSVGPNAFRAFVYTSAQGLQFLPTVPGLGYVRPVDINDNGWITGTASSNSSLVGMHAVVWQPVPSGYQARDLGTLPGKSESFAVGIDMANRVIGWSTTSTFPPDGKPFLWAAATGMSDLTVSGAPREIPQDVSANGTVLVRTGSYRAGIADSFHALPPLPPGWASLYLMGAINDSGDQVRVLIPPSSVSPFGVFRLSATTGTWTRVGTMSQGRLSRNVLGNLDNNGDFTATLYGVGTVGFGPQGSATAIDSMLSPAYPGATATDAVSVNNRRQIAGSAIIGRSSRLVRFDPVEPCVGSCVRVSAINVKAKLISPVRGQCLPTAHTHAVATIKVLDSRNAPVAGASVRLTLLDDVSVSMSIAATTNASGVARVVRDLPPCGGAVAVLVGNVIAAGASLDRTVGELTDYAITTA